MQVIITILIIAGIVMFFGPESCSSSDSTATESEVQSEENASGTNTSDQSVEMDQPLL